MASVADVYSVLLNELIEKHFGRQSAFAQLKSYFEDTEKLTVVILDEMDVLLTKKSTELYNLCQWSYSGKLCIIGISNTVDLPRRLPPAIQTSNHDLRNVFSSVSAGALEQTR